MTRILPPLPIDDALPRLRAALTNGTRAVLQAPPGAGKTTRVPLALLDEPWLASGKVIMLEPRRLATRAAAHHMAGLLGERTGQTVGYRVRGDSRVSRSTRVEVVTEGVLTRVIQDDPSLEGIAALIFDEFHERNLVADLGLALAIQSAELLRPELRLLVMSATLDGERVARLLGGAPVVTSAGRAFGVETRWVPRREGQRVEGAVAATVEQAMREHEGDVLVFLPGAAEIRRTASILSGRLLGPRTTIYSLHGSLPTEEQDRAIAPSPPGTRKVVLSTSVAETSLTIEGVRIVVDSGLSRIPRFSPRTGMTRLETVRVARDSADQRRGRAGRVSTGFCYRLWSEGEEAQLLAHRNPEILEADLAPLALELAAAGIASPEALRWLDLPPAGALTQARELLRSLGALASDGRLTAHGKEMAGAGIHPRLAHLVLTGERMGAGALACDVAALLGERDLLRRDAAVNDPDLRTRLELLRARGGADDPRADRARVFQVRDEARRLRAERGGRDSAWHDEKDNVLDRARDNVPGDDLLGALVALAYPDRIARRRSDTRGRVQLRNGLGAVVNAGSALADSEWIAIAETDGAKSEARVYLGATLDAAAVHELFADAIEREDVVEFDAAVGGVVATRRERLGALVLSDRALHAPDPDAVTAAMIAGIRRHGLTVLPFDESVERLRQRVSFLRTIDPTWPDWSDAALLATLEEWLGPTLHGLRRRSELARLDLPSALLGTLPWASRGALDTLAPTHLEVPSGSRIAVDYASPTAPALPVRLQELFGLADTPRLAGGKVPVVLHLLSPARRPVQVTSDLAGFWRTTYFDVRKDLRGRYPKHSWPDNPLQAAPTRKIRRPG